MPLNICTLCLSDLIKTHLFQEKSQQSNIILQTVKDNNGIQVLEEEKKVEITENLIKDYNSNDEINTDDEENDIESITIELNEEKPDVLYDKQNNLDYERKFSIKENDTQTEEHVPRKKPKRICTVCSKVICSSKLKQHMRSHTKEKPYTCNICSQRFSVGGNLKRHMMTHTGERPHVCDICGKGKLKQNN